MTLNLNSFFSDFVSVKKKRGKKRKRRKPFLQLKISGQYEKMEIKSHIKTVQLIAHSTLKTGRKKHPHLNRIESSAINLKKKIKKREVDTAEVLQLGKGN